MLVPLPRHYGWKPSESRRITTDVHGLLTCTNAKSAQHPSRPITVCKQGVVGSSPIVSTERVRVNRDAAVIRRVDNATRSARTPRTRRHAVARRRTRMHRRPRRSHSQNRSTVPVRNSPRCAMEVPREHETFDRRSRAAHRAGFGSSSWCRDRRTAASWERSSSAVGPSARRSTVRARPDKRVRVDGQHLHDRCLRFRATACVVASPLRHQRRSRAAGRGPSMRRGSAERPIRVGPSRARSTRHR